MKRIKNLKFLAFIFTLWFLPLAFAQEGDIEYALDVNSNTVALPNILRPSADLSGRGFKQEAGWPQNLAAGEALDAWQNDIGFKGIYRLQFDLWEINELANDKESQNRLLSNYDSLMKKISDAGGIVILDIFGTPAGLGRVLDKKSAIVNIEAFKKLIKSYVRNFSCIKRYNVWYEIWTAPDLDDFFLGRRQDYLNIYRAVAEGIKELEQETKVYIPVGGPGVSWWFRNMEENTSVTPEKSLIYELIRFCAHYKLPLDFITWHAYSTDPMTEKEITKYNNNAIRLIRDWLTYFNFEKSVPLIVDEWNYDREDNLLFERGEKSYVCASFIPARLKNMYDAGLDYQLFFSLEDFRNVREGVVRNVGIFWFAPKTAGYDGGPKTIYNVFKMLSNLRENMFVIPKSSDDFVTVIATKNQDSIAILIDNYIDPGIAKNYLSRNIAGLKDGERKILLNLIRSERLAKILGHQADISTLRRLSNKVKAQVKKSLELNDLAQKFITTDRNINISLKNLKDDYSYERYLVDSSCSINCEFVPVEQKEISAPDLYQEKLTLSPYSVNLIILKKKPKAAITADTQVSTEAIPQVNNTTR